jgi:MoxR-like ATPase
MTAKALSDMQALVRTLPVGESVLDAILTLVRNARPDQSEDEMIRKTVSWGPGPRAGQALMLATRAKALLDGRIAPSVDDVIDLAGPVLRHRMALSFAARADGMTIDSTINRLVERIR